MRWRKGEREGSEGKDARSRRWKAMDRKEGTEHPPTTQTSTLCALHPFGPCYALLLMPLSSIRRWDGWMCVECGVCFPWRLFVPSYGNVFFFFRINDDDDGNDDEKKFLYFAPMKKRAKSVSPPPLLPSLTHTFSFLVNHPFQTQTHTPSLPPLFFSLLSLSHSLTLSLLFDPFNLQFIQILYITSHILASTQLNHN